MLFLIFATFVHAHVGDVECLNFRKTVMEKAITTKYDDDPNYVTPHRFVESEAQARAFLSQVDVKKLNIAVPQIENSLAYCRANPEHQAPLNKNTCSSRAYVGPFFEGLAYGLKNYKWSTQTKELGMAKYRAYAKEVLEKANDQQEFSVLLKTLSIFNSFGLLKSDMKETISKVSLDYSSDFAKLPWPYKGTGKPAQCRAYLDYHAGLKIFLADYAKKIDPLIP